MMEDALDKKINCIIEKDLSRFGRDFIETGRYLQRILPSYGIRFITVLDHVDTLHTPPQDDIVMQIKAIINDEFSREISLRTRNSLKTMRQSGLYVGACPIYGYQKSPDTRNKLVPDINTARVVKRIFHLKLTGMSARKIAEQLNAEHILSPLAYKKNSGLPQPHHGFADKENAQWSANTILRILKDETYTGTLVQGKQYKMNYKFQKNVTRPASEWARCKNTHNAIISSFDFETVQRVMLLDTRTSPGCDVVNLFSGILICSSCSGNMTRKTIKIENTVYRYYYCPKGKQKGCLRSVMIEGSALISATFKGVQQYIERVRLLSEKMLHMTEKEKVQIFTKDKLALIKNTQERLQKAKEYKSSLRVSEFRGVVSPENRKDMEDTYAEEILLLETQIAEIIEDVQSIADHIDEYVEKLILISKLADRISFDRGEVVRLVKRIVVLSKSEIFLEFILEF